MGGACCGKGALFLPAGPLIMGRSQEKYGILMPDVPSPRTDMRNRSMKPHNRQALHATPRSMVRDFAHEAKERKAEIDMAPIYRKGARPGHRAVRPPSFGKALVVTGA